MLGFFQMLGFYFSTVLYKERQILTVVKPQMKNIRGSQHSGQQVTVISFSVDSLSFVFNKNYL